MALQDLTPQLRTRLNRVEKAVGWFVLLATLLLLSGFSYYVYSTAQRKGWLESKVRCFTFSDRATGLKMGDPVKLMGFDVGQITRITAQPANEFTYNVYVEFEIKKTYAGYLWTEGSHARVVTADFLGQRAVEITRGTNGYAFVCFNAFKEFPIQELEKEPDIEKWILGREFRDASNNVVLPAKLPLTRDIRARLAELGVTNIPAWHSTRTHKTATAIWDLSKAAYVPYKPSKPLWLLADESPAVTERLERLVGQAEKALPNILELTNRIASVLDNASQFTSNLDVTVTSARPAISNLASLSGEIRGKGALGEWMLPGDIHGEMARTLTNASAMLASAHGTVAITETQLPVVISNLNVSLENLGGITSNLNAQVQSNTNILTSISSAIVHTDDLIQGLKRHWLLRSAFKTNAPPAPKSTNDNVWILRSPKDASR
jgi:ABC-type transporter Mla subunit MlaD